MSDSETDQSDGPKPWTVKGIGIEERNAAIAAAKRAKEPIGTWLARAIRSQAQSDAGQTRAMTVTKDQSDDSEEKTDYPAVQSDLEDLERIVGLAVKLAEVGGPAPKTIAQQVHRAMLRRLKAMR